MTEGGPNEIQNRARVESDVAHGHDDDAASIPSTEALAKAAEAGEAGEAGEAASSAISPGLPSRDSGSPSDSDSSIVHDPIPILTGQLQKISESAGITNLHFSDIEPLFSKPPLSIEANSTQQKYLFQASLNLIDSEQFELSRSILEILIVECDMGVKHVHTWATNYMAKRRMHEADTGLEFKEFRETLAVLYAAGCSFGWETFAHEGTKINDPHFTEIAFPKAITDTLKAAGVKASILPIAEDENLTPKLVQKLATLAYQYPGSDIWKKLTSDLTPKEKQYLTVFCVRSGNLAGFQALIDEGLDLTTPLENKFGMTPMHWIAMSKDTSFLQAYHHKCWRNGHLFVKDKFGNTPMHYAAMADNQAGIDALCNAFTGVQSWFHKAKPGLKKAYNYTASIPWALVRVKTKSSVTPVLAPIDATHSVLIDEKNEYGLTPVHLAAASSSKQAIETLAEQGADLDFKWDRKLQLFRDKAKAWRDQSPLLRMRDLASAAAFNGVMMGVDLRPLGADVKLPSYAEAMPFELKDEEINPDMLAAKFKLFRSDFEGIKHPEYDKDDNLVSYRAMLTRLQLEWNYRVLIGGGYAIASTPIEAVNWVLKQMGTAPIDWTEKAKHPIEMMASEGNNESLSALLKAGADPSLRDVEGNYPLHHATLSGDLDCVETLLKSIDALPEEYVNFKGQTPIHLAVMAGNAEMVEHWLTKGLLNSKDKFGQTPLHYAALRGDKKLIQLLLDAGAHVDDAPHMNTENTFGHTPKDLLESRGA